MANPEENRLLVVVNPYSTRAGVIRERAINPLDDSVWSDNYEAVFTQYESAGDNIKQITEEIRDGDVLLSCGGDGMAHITANALASADARETTAIFMPFGNANDISFSLYGKNISKKQRFLEKLADGVRSPVHSIAVELEDQAPEYALGYVTIGATGKIADVWCDKGFRQKKHDSKLPGKALETAEILKALWNAEPFTYSEDGAVVEAQDLIFMKTRRMAQLIRGAVVTENPDMLMREFGNAMFFPKVLGALAAQNNFGGIRGDLVVTRSLTVHTPVFMQLDGEAQKVDPDTEITVSIAPGTLNTLK